MNVNLQSTSPANPKKATVWQQTLGQIYRSNRPRRWIRWVRVKNPARAGVWADAIRICQRRDVRTSFSLARRASPIYTNAQ